LSAPPDALVVAGRRRGNKGRRKKEEGGRQEKEGKGKLHTHEVFCEHLARLLIQPPICVTYCSARNGRKCRFCWSSRPDPWVYPYP